MCMRTPPFPGIFLSSSVLFQCSQAPGVPSEELFVRAYLMPIALTQDRKTGICAQVMSVLFHLVTVCLSQDRRSDNPLIYLTVLCPGVFSVRGLGWALGCGEQDQPPSLGESELSSARGVRVGLGKGRDQHVGPESTEAS